MELYYKCIKCQKIYPFSKEIFTCENHSPYYGYLTLMYDYKNITLGGENDFWEKYDSLLPADKLNINFNEQKTPLMKLENFGRKYGFAQLYLKDESKNPTGSFKDKESLCAINKAVEWDINEIFVVSSGNAAVSTSAYAQKAGINCTCYVPSSLSVGKRLLIGMYGGKIIENEGNYEEIYKRAVDAPFSGWNCTPGINPIKEEGIKIIGFEIYEDIGVPDTIVVPCGNGTLLFGIYKAFKELQFLGLISKLPKMIGVQIKDAAPLKAAMLRQEDFIALSNVTDSIAEGIVAQESFSSPKVMHALAETNGEIIVVDDTEVKFGLKEIINLESLIPEPTSAVVFAALKKIKMDKTEKIAVVQTAGGLKNLREIMQVNSGD